MRGKLVTLLLVGPICWVMVFPMAALAQTKVKLGLVTPGTEKVQLVYNGDFGSQGILVNGSHPYPEGWLNAAGKISADPGTNVVAVNDNVVARVDVTSPNVPLHLRFLQLEPNTTYVLSCYMWNFGDSANRVTTVIDFNDIAGEPQMALVYNDADADKGYFVYRSFNSATTGTNVTLRLFCDGFTGTGAASNYFPIGAQWDNFAVTKSSEFVAPNLGGNIRPIVRITNPTVPLTITRHGPTPKLQIDAAATDFNGSVARVDFYEGTNFLGQKFSPPYFQVWSNFTSGSYGLTAVATDNLGARTVSAVLPVLISVLPVVKLKISATPETVAISWSTAATSAGLLISTNLSATNWTAIKTSVVATNGTNTATITPGNKQQFFLLGDDVDNSTMNGKHMVGYQGWFNCPNDGSYANRWQHWFKTQSPTEPNLRVDMWPDTSELDPDELFTTSMTMSNGAPAKVYSAYRQKTVHRHFKWMKEHHIDGVFVQRFLSEISDPLQFEVRNQVTDHVRTGSETYGRVFALMYDISGQPQSTVVSALTNDWAYLVETLKITNSPRYLRHKGRPVIAIWGFGFGDRPGTPAQAQTVIDHFKAAGLTVMGGVPTYWRTLTADSRTDPAWASVYRSFDIISPWSVGRYSTQSGADNFKVNLIVPDLAEANAHGRDYMPVIFPGFSWHNLFRTDPLNAIPRNGGTFYWRQAYNVVSAGCNMIFGAMFDEMDEGTAMFKVAATSADLPIQGSFVPLNADGYSLPSDWYLRLADETGKMLRSETPLQIQMPISP